MEELYKVMDELLDLEFQIKAGMDILKELEELYTSDPEKEETEAETEEFFYRLGIKDGLRLKSTIKSVLEMMS